MLVSNTPGRIVALLVAAGLCTVAGVAGAQTFKTAVEQVVVPVTILSKPDAPPVDLQPADFRVFDDEMAVEVVTFGKIRQPVHILLLLDTSRSLMLSLSDVRNAADAVMAHLSADDTVAVGTFSNALRLSPNFSAGDRRVVARLPFVPGENMTMLYDALVKGCVAFTTRTHRRVIFVVSDGADTASSSSAREVMQQAAEESVTIYAVGVTSRYLERGRTVTRAPAAVLREMAENTGGAYVYAESNRDFSKLFATMIEELHDQYILGFTPAHADGRVHSLLVTTRRSDIRVRARQHYRAPLLVP
jgi:VWFA-related protein